MATSQSLRPQQNLIHVDILETFPKSVKLPALYPPLRVDRCRISLFLQLNLESVAGSVLRVIAETDQKECLDMQHN